MKKRKTQKREIGRWKRHYRKKESGRDSRSGKKGQTSGAGLKVKTAGEKKGKKKRRDGTAETERS